MKRLNEFRKTISWILVLTFSMLVNLQAAPLGKVGTETDKNYISAGSDEMGQFEKEDKSIEVKKKKRFPWIFVALGATAVVAVFYIMSLRGKKIGTYNNIKVGFTVKFGGCNSKIRYAVLVDGISKMNEILVFEAPAIMNPATWTNIERNFWIEKTQLENILIRLEIGPETQYINPSEGIGQKAVQFDLAVLGYSYSGGKDPGQPILSETSFSIHCDWKFNQKTTVEKTIILSAPDQ